MYCFSPILCNGLSLFCLFTLYFCTQHSPTCLITATPQTSKQPVYYERPDQKSEAGDFLELKYGSKNDQTSTWVYSERNTIADLTELLGLHWNQ